MRTIIWWGSSSNQQTNTRNCTISTWIRSLTVIFSTNDDVFLYKIAGANFVLQKINVAEKNIERNMLFVRFGCNSFVITWTHLEMVLSFTERSSWEQNFWTNSRLFTRILWNNNLNDWLVILTSHKVPSQHEYIWAVSAVNLVGTQRERRANSGIEIPIWTQKQINWLKMWMKRTWTCLILASELPYSR